MTNHPGRKPGPLGPFASRAEQSARLASLRREADLSQPQAAALVHAGVQTWRQWERGERAMPAAAMELLCLALIVGTVERGPYVPPGDWLLPYVRREFALWFRRR